MSNNSDTPENFVEKPDVISTEEANSIERNGKLLDLRGEVCPEPQIIAQITLPDLLSGQVLILFTDHVDAVENVPRAVKGLVSMVKVWKSGKGEYKIFLWRK